MRLVPAFLALAAIAGAPAAAAVRDWPLAGFDRVELDAPADLTIRSGDRFSIRADGDPELVGRLAPALRGDTLVLGFDRRPGISVDRRKLSIAITMPRVAGAGVSGVGHATVDRADAPLVVLAVSGTGSLEVAQVRADRTVLALSGTGSIAVAGETRHLDARRSGIGSIDAAKLGARSAVLRSSGVGSLAARVDGPADVTLSGIGSVTVRGHPVCTVKRSGIGSVECG